MNGRRDHRDALPSSEGRTCKDLLDFLDDYTEGALPAGEQRRFEAHLDVCPPCQDYLSSYRTTVGLTQEAYQDEACEDLPEDLVRAILDARRSS